jgi:hypothetical protein
MKSFMHIANRCAPRKITNGAANLILQSLQFQLVTFCRKFPDVRVRVTLRLTVSQSVSLGVEPNLGLLTRDIFFFQSYCLVFLWMPVSYTLPASRAWANAPMIG